MISIEEFKLFFNPIQQFLLEEDTNQKSIDILFPDSFARLSQGERLLDSYIRLLEKICEDTEEWINYFVWDCDCGKNPQNIEINNKKSKLKTIDDLYKVLTKIKR
jgi:hypothetical protein